MRGYKSVPQWYSPHSEMALTPELYDTPASRLDSFVTQWLQPSRDWKEEVLEAVRTVQKFLREEHFEGEHGLDQEARVLKVVKVRLVAPIHRPGPGKGSMGVLASEDAWGRLASLSSARAADTSGHPS